MDATNENDLKLLDLKLGEIAKLDYQDGDVFVWMTNSVPSEAELRHLEKWWEDHVPGTRCLMMRHGDKLGVLRRKLPIGQG